MKISRLPPRQRAALVKALRAPRYELVPTSSARQAVEALPEGSKVTITASPRRGQDASIDLAEELAGDGFAVVPHLAARLFRDRAHLDKTLDRLVDAGVEELFVIGGDGDPRGDLTEALDVLRVIAGSGHSFDIGIAGYPEGHPFLDDKTLLRSLRLKEPHASYLITQMSFDAGALGSWIGEMRERGLSLPVLIGLPGLVAVPRLLRLATRIGVGDSIRFLARQRGLWRRLLTPVYSPTGLALELAGTLSDASMGVVGLHFYSFNQVEATERWRRKLIAELEP